MNITIMVILYMKNIAYEKAFDLVDELKELCHEKKNIMCELEQALRQCMEYGEDEEYDDSEDYDSDTDGDLYGDDDVMTNRRMQRGDKRS